MRPRRSDPEPLSPGVARLLHRLAGMLGFAAGVLFLVAFLLGILREDATRWLLLALGLLFLASPLVLRQMMPRA